MRRQLVPGLVVRLTVIKAKTRPGIEANVNVVVSNGYTLKDTTPNNAQALINLPIKT